MEFVQFSCEIVLEEAHKSIMFLTKCNLMPE